jgi:hypothetical protein
MRARSQATWRFKDGFRDRPGNLGGQQSTGRKYGVCSHMEDEQAHKRFCSEKQGLCHCFEGSYIELGGFGRVSKFNAKDQVLD